MRQRLPSRVKFIRATDTGKLGLKMGRCGLLLSLMLDKLFFLLSHLSLNPAKPAPYSQHHLVDFLKYGCWTPSGIFTFALCIHREKKGTVNLSKSWQMPNQVYFFFSIASQLGCIFKTSTKMHPHFCVLLVVQANSGALFNWDDIFCCEL